MAHTTDTQYPPVDEKTVNVLKAAVWNYITDPTHEAPYLIPLPTHETPLTLQNLTLPTHLKRAALFCLSQLARLTQSNGSSLETFGFLFQSDQGGYLKSQLETLPNQDSQYTLFILLTKQFLSLLDSVEPNTLTPHLGLKVIEQRKCRLNRCPAILFQGVRVPFFPEDTWILPLVDYVFRASEGDPPTHRIEQPFFSWTLQGDRLNWSLLQHCLDISLLESPESPSED